LAIIGRCSGENRRVTVNLLTASGKKEFRQRFSRFSEIWRPMNNWMAKPVGVAIANRKKTAVYQHDVTAVFTGN
jgi:hypothetical protein